MSYASQKADGKVAEWLNAADSKSVIGFIPIGGSNPPLSASLLKICEKSRKIKADNQKSVDKRLFLCYIPHFENLDTRMGKNDCKNNCFRK